MKLASHFLMRQAARPIVRLVRLFMLALRHARSGKHLQIGSGVVITGGKHIDLGDGVSLGDHAELLGQTPDGSPAPIVFGRSVKISKRCQIAPSHGGRVVIGDFSTVHNNSYLLGHVIIGRYCLLSANIFASSADHYAFVSPELLIHDQDAAFGGGVSHSSNPVYIEDDCWIGWGAIIKKGVLIGKGAVVGANSVVTRDVPPYAVVAGQPARLIRNRLPFDPPASLQASASEAWPYLYRGFLLSDRERKESRLDGCIGAHRHAVAVLRSGPFSAVDVSGAVAARRVRLTITINESRQTSVDLPRGPFSLSLPQEEFRDGVANEVRVSGRASFLAAWNVIAFSSTDLEPQTDDEHALWGLRRVVLHPAAGR